MPNQNIQTAQADAALLARLVKLARRLGDAADAVALVLPCIHPSAARALAGQVRRAVLASA